MSIFERFPRFEFCCFVFDLRLGALAIGVFLALNALGSLITNIAAGVSSIFVYITYILSFVLAIYLILGAYREKAKWVEYYLWGKLIFLVIELIIIISLFFSTAGNALWMLLTWALDVYFWMCVNSYFLKLEGIVPATTTTTVTRTVTTA